MINAILLADNGQRNKGKRIWCIGIVAGCAEVRIRNSTPPGPVLAGSVDHTKTKQQNMKFARLSICVVWAGVAPDAYTENHKLFTMMLVRL